MKKIAFMFALLLCCGSAFAFDQIVGDITTGFSRDNRLEVVRDDIYKLMWQDGDLPPFRMYYDKAVQYCENLNFAGFDDWRLPTVNELLSIIDYSKYSSAMNLAFKYADIPSGKYWSSTKSADDSSDVWVVDFDNGEDFRYSVSSHKGLVRCVRQY
ncbi:DUF1566 domain-containing protein [Campylobacter concisus]|jgi:hypothetical protein|uniref:Lcl C-terminal domain-containing protein n=1 Tax=Campylobacter concisus UNSW2 TaxID=1242965 RepID=U2FNV8_9BACT|nr:DUF1566 domain-containing protein [Campylobacter concisus]ERJ32115.1 Hypothetical protein UNSW2_433 [Campylobacter concisus UNSW2]MBE9856885.1 DUF1566 domain-containing protein [Campylobacter concisus]